MKEGQQPSIEVLDPKLAEELAKKKAEHLSNEPPNEEWTLEELDQYPCRGQVPPRLAGRGRTAVRAKALIVRELAKPV